MSRSARAKALTVHPLGGRRFYVTGGSEGHWVDLDGADPCDCADHLLKGSLCKHILACRMYLEAA